LFNERRCARPLDDESKGIWFECLRSLGIRPRKLYTTRHTFIPWPLSEGANLKGLAWYCGTSVKMVEQSYGRYIRKDLLGPLMAARLEGPLKGVLGKGPNFLANSGGGGGYSTAQGSEPYHRESA